MHCMLVVSCKSSEFLNFFKMTGYILIYQ